MVVCRFSTVHLCTCLHQITGCLKEYFKAVNDTCKSEEELLDGGGMKLSLDEMNSNVPRYDEV